MIAMTMLQRVPPPRMSVVGRLMMGRMLVVGKETQCLCVVRAAGSLSEDLPRLGKGKLPCL